MRNFQDVFETRKRSFISAFLICMTVLLSLINRVIGMLTSLACSGAHVFDVLACFLGLRGYVFASSRACLFYT